MTATDDLIKEFQEIHERIFELACRKSKYAAKMSDPLNKAIEAALENEYKTYYGLYKEKLDAAVAIDLFALKEKRDIMVPRRWRNWWSFWKVHTNEAYDRAEERIEGDAHLYYEELMEHLETLKNEFEKRRAAPSATAADAAPASAPVSQQARPLGDGEAPVESLDRGGRPAGSAEAWEEEEHDIISDEGIASPS